MSLKDILRGVSGEIEIGRVFLASSGISAIFAPLGFEGWDLLHGAHFDVAAWCAAYPAGLAALHGVGIFAIGSKDKAGAEARTMSAPPPGGQP